MFFDWFVFQNPVIIKKCVFLLSASSTHLDGDITSFCEKSTSNKSKKIIIIKWLYWLQCTRFLKCDILLPQFWKSTNWINCRRLLINLSSYSPNSPLHSSPGHFKDSPTGQHSRLVWCPMISPLLHPSLLPMFTWVLLAQQCFPLSKLNGVLEGHGTEAGKVQAKWCREL